MLIPAGYILLHFMCLIKTKEERSKAALSTAGWNTIDVTVYNLLRFVCHPRYILKTKTWMLLRMFGRILYVFTTLTGPNVCLGQQQ